VPTRAHACSRVPTMDEHIEGQADVTFTPVS
jgi:hypothetical protein